MAENDRGQIEPEPFWEGLKTPGEVPTMSKPKRRAWWIVGAALALGIGTGACLSGCNTILKAKAEQNLVEVKWLAGKVQERPPSDEFLAKTEAFRAKAAIAGAESLVKDAEGGDDGDN